MYFNVVTALLLFPTFHTESDSSLSLQAVLVLFAPLRKATGNKLIISVIWSAYLIADWAANFGVGLITERARDTPTAEYSSKQQPAENNELLAFWATFFMLHLGGPDTITAFALEDNELWLRHLFGLIFQAVAAVYIFLTSLPGNKLFFPTALVFIAGMIKYFERIRALYLASMEKFRDSALRGEVEHLKRIRSLQKKNVAALSVFHFQVEKHGFNEFDVCVTYTLFLGAIALDIIAFFKLVFSDWTRYSLLVSHSQDTSMAFTWRWQVRGVGHTFLVPQVVWFRLRFQLDEILAQGTSKQSTQSQEWFASSLPENNRDAANEFFRKKSLKPSAEKFACEKIMLEPDLIFSDPHDRKEFSALEDATALACERQMLDEDKKWERVSKVWMEILSYGAIHCSPMTHAQQVTSGGELITFVWLLMHHFNLVEPQA
ncbi:DUF4220 domain-containing protein [Citrus sinensis]|uniref:DUF4220 domain-containing protein n=1 Tax=Citrus sinensis TaxID=2711 RepID=A0ACB8JKZ6_CITSI|nr:DUF4220 domain-containing protein [Citrus sinensis]